jgi:glycosyltransferase involved in cell wall biosynthesis
MKIGLIVPHIFMQDSLLPKVIFSPGRQAAALADGLVAGGHEVTLFTPGPVTTKARNSTVDLSYFDDELASRGYGYIELLKKHPLTFISLARQAQSELIAEAFRQANQSQFDLLHIYTNEEDIALPFIQFCAKPVVLTHHDPFNFSTQYRTVFPKYHELNWLSLSLAQRAAMPEDTNWVGNIYHGLATGRFQANLKPSGDYIAYCGRIIEAKGVHLAIAALKKYNAGVPPSDRLALRIAGKHYAGQAKDSYWQEKIAPEIDNRQVLYDGFLKTDAELEDFLGNARALVIPSTFSEPFGLVMAEALACGTPIVGLGTGAIPEVITEGKTGFLVYPTMQPKDAKGQTRIDESKTARDIAEALKKVVSITRIDCRQEFEERFTLERMCAEHVRVYESLLK